MPNVNDLKNSKYLTKEDVSPDKLVTISKYDECDVSMENQPTSMKWILYFDEFEKGLVLNNTNGQRIAYVMETTYGITQMQGDFETWIGKKVVLYNDPMVEFAGKLVGGIRVKAPQNVVAANADTPPPEDTRDHVDGVPEDELPESLR